MSRQRIFITRKIPQKGLDIILAEPDIDVDIWPEKLPPSRRVLLEKVRGVTGL